MDARSLIALLALMLSCSLMVECAPQRGAQHSGNEQLAPQQPCEDKQTMNDCLVCCNGKMYWDLVKSVCRCEGQSSQQQVQPQIQQLEPCEDKPTMNDCLVCCNGRMNWDLVKGVCRCENQFQPEIQQLQQEESQQYDERRCEHKQNYGDCKKCCGGNVLDHAAVKGRCLCAGHPLYGAGADQQADESRRPEKVDNNDNAASTQLDRETCKERFEELFTVTMKVPEEIQNLIKEINKVQPELKSMQDLDWSKILNLYTDEHRQKCREYLQSGLKAFAENKDLTECQEVVGLPGILAFLETKEFAKAFPICYRLTM